MQTKDHPLTAAPTIGLFICCLFYLVLTTAGNGTPSLPESDSSIYMVYARNMAQGTPYVFSAGDAPSTGSTSHLYIFVLSLIYKLGFSGDSAVTAAYVLNALFYLACIPLAGLIAKKLAPAVSTYALFMTALSGHLIAACLHLTDIGFFTFLTLGGIASMLYGKPRLCFIFIILCALTRPEGFIFSAAYILTGVICKWTNRTRLNNTDINKQANLFLAYGLTGATTFSVILLLNHALTGHTQFMSVVNKGYFTQYPPAAAVHFTLHDFYILLKGILLSLPELTRPNRQYFQLPLLGGLLALTGIMLRPRKEKLINTAEIWILLTAGAALLVVASSQWQGLSDDRYLAWFFPIWSIYTLIGINELQRRVKYRTFAPILLSILILSQLASIIFVFTSSYTYSLRSELRKAFCIKAAEHLSPGETIGSLAGATRIEYYTPSCKTHNLAGITSPGFSNPRFDPGYTRVIDILKHRPDLRFNYWYMLADYEETPWLQPFFGPDRLKDTDSALASSTPRLLRETDWTTLDGGSLPVLCTNTLTEFTLVDSLDIGYQNDELKFNYRVQSRFKNTIFRLIATTDKLQDSDYSETGRLIFGSEIFQPANICKEKPLRIIMRTSSTAKGTSVGGTGTIELDDVQMEESLVLRVFVDDIELPMNPLSIKPTGFSEIYFDIPAGLMTTDTPKIEVLGDHISYAYWFYQ